MTLLCRTLFLATFCLTSSCRKPQQQSSTQENWQWGMPHSIEPKDSSLLDSGTATLREIIGQKEAIFVSKSIRGLCSLLEDDVVEYSRSSGKTSLRFPSGWIVEVCDKTGEFAIPKDISALSDKRLTDITRESMQKSGILDKWRNSYKHVTDDGTVLQELSDIRIDEIRRVYDKAFVAWRLVANPPAPDGSFLRIVYWIDLRSRDIVFEGVEIHEP